MRKESHAILLNLYEYIAQYLKANHYCGVTILRGIEGFGQTSLIHKSDILDLSSDLPIVIEIVDSEEKIGSLKEVMDKEGWIESGLVTEEKVSIVRYGKDDSL